MAVDGHASGNTYMSPSCRVADHDACHARLVVRCGCSCHRLVGIAWREQGSRLDLTYAEGKSEQVRGVREVAAVLAKDAGLSLTSNTDGMWRWG